MTTRSVKKPPASPLTCQTAAEAMANQAMVFCIPVTAFTLEGFRKWCDSPAFPDQGRIAFLGEEILIDMTNERLESHVKVKTEVIRVVGNLVVDEDLGNLYSDGARLVNETAQLSNDPDASFASWESLESGRVRPVPSTTDDGDFTELAGSPDWVLEVISPSSVQKDTARLRVVYHRAGIREYWLIDARGAEIVFQILYWREDGYVTAARRGGWQRSEVFARSFRLERRRDRLGQWQYRLKVKASS
jgi:Uma2 family endonuclease